MVELVLRIITLSQLITAALVALKVRNKSLAVKIFILFLLALSCYVAYPLLDDKLPFYLHVFISLGVFAIPFLFWMFCEAIFTEGFKIKLQHYIFLLFFLCLRFLAYWITEGEEADHFLIPPFYLDLIPRLLIFFCVGMALKRTISDWRDDLVEERRRIRFFFLIVLGIEILVVTSVESYLSLHDLGDPPILVLVHVAFMFLLGLWFSLRMFSLEAPFLLPVPQRVLEPDPAPPEIDLIKKLSTLMEQEQFYREEGLTIGILAQKLGEPEYRLRQAINQGLGFRNFNSYLNSLRIQAAAKMLSDPKYQEEKILAIALQAGFRSLAPFNKAFKESLQMTPSEYRSQQKSGLKSP